MIGVILAATLAVRQRLAAVMSKLVIFVQLLSELLSYAIIRAYETVKYLFHQGYRDGRQRLPPVRQNFLAFSAVRLAKMIRDKELTSEALVQAMIERIRETEPFLNAVIEDRFEAAMADARQADQELNDCTDIDELARTKPFLGVPFTAKDGFGIKGMLADIGSEVLRGQRAENDALVGERLVSAGAIPLAITNVPEMCLWIETSNHLHGRTNNPYDIHRTCGGSSGGEAALIAACASVWGVGSDISGSIRLPSAWCGLFGHKPTPGIIPRKGFLPEHGQELKSRIGVLGPMTRSADDLVAMLRLMADDPGSLDLDEPVDIGSLRYFYCDYEGSSFVSSVQPEVRRQVQRVVHFIRSDFGLKAEPLPNPEKMANHQAYFFSYLANKNFPPLKSSFDLPEISWDPCIEAIKHAGGFSKHTLYGIVVSFLDDLYRGDLENCQTIYQDFEKYREDIYELLGEDGVLILPSSASVAPFHHGTLCNPMLYFGLAGLINVLRIPATVVPMGLNSKGIPLSVQIVAGPRQDRLCLAVAKELERKFGGFVPPCHVQA